MTDDDLFEATVPVFAHYNRRIEAIVSGLSPEDTQLLECALTKDTFSAGEHFNISQGYMQRTIFPVLGLEIPNLSPDKSNATSLLTRCHTLADRLHGIKKVDFKGAHSRHIQHTAGQAELVQPATEFVTLYAVPNFFFHLTMGYATLRQAGVSLGKADFDGHHSYPSDFSFN